MLAQLPSMLEANKLYLQKTSVFSNASYEIETIHWQNNGMHLNLILPFQILMSFAFGSYCPMWRQFWILLQLDFPIALNGRIQVFKLGFMVQTAQLSATKMTLPSLKCKLMWCISHWSVNLGLQIIFFNVLMFEIITCNIALSFQTWCSKRFVYIQVIFFVWKLWFCITIQGKGW